MLFGLLTIYTLVIAYVTSAIDYVKSYVTWPFQKSKPVTSVNPGVTSNTPSGPPVIDIAKCAELAINLSNAKNNYNMSSAQFGTLKQDVCPAYDELIAQCGSNFNSDSLYTKWCADTTCIDTHVAQDAAIADFIYQTGQGITVDGQYQLAASSLCPAFNNVIKSCTTTPDDPLYTKWCADPTCVTNKRALNAAIVDFNWQKSQNLSQDGQFQEMIGTVCPAYETAIASCPDEHYQTDALYQQYCASIDCTKAEQARDAAIADFNNQTSLDFDGQFQMATKSLCPAFSNILKSCTTSITDPLYKTWCANPTCVTNKDKLFNSLKGYNYAVSQGVTKDGQYSMLIDDVCPTYETAIASCPDENYQSDALYKQYCKTIDCTKAERTVDAALKDFRWQVSQGITSDGQYQLATKNLCPAYETIVTSCGTTPTDQEYLDYCAQPVCAKDLNALQEAKKAYDYGVANGTTADGQYQTLLDSVCPAYQTMQNDCISKLPTDAIYQNYCRDTKCTTARRVLDAAKADLQWQTSQGLTQSGQAQLIFSKICPAMKNVLQTCTDPAVIASITSDPLYTNWCEYQDCAVSRQAITDAETSLDWQISQKLTQDGIYQIVAQSVCPAIATAIATCPADHVAQITQDHWYTDYCQYPTCTAARRAAQHQEDSLDWSISQGMTQDGQNQTLNSYMCPALVTMQNACPVDHQLQSRYQTPCNDLKCGNELQNLNTAISNYNWQAPQVNAIGRAQLLTGTVCPAFAALPDCSAAQVTAAQSGALWAACQYGAACPMDQYQMSNTLSIMRQPGSLFNYSSNYANYVTNYCGAAAKVAADPSQCGVTMDPEYQDFCVDNSCATNIMDLNKFIIDNNQNWNNYNDSMRRYIAQYASGSIQGIRANCSADKIAQYTSKSTIPNVAWYMSL